MMEAINAEPHDLMRTILIDPTSPAMARTGTSDIPTILPTILALLTPDGALVSFESSISSGMLKAMLATE